MSTVKVLKMLSCASITVNTPRRIRRRAQHRATLDEQVTAE